MDSSSAKASAGGHPREADVSRRADVPPIAAAPELLAVAWDVPDMEAYLKASQSVSKPKP